MKAYADDACLLTLLIKYLFDFIAIILWLVSGQNNLREDFLHSASVLGQHRSALEWHWRYVLFLPHLVIDSEKVVAAAASMTTKTASHIHFIHHLLAALVGAGYFLICVCVVSYRLVSYGVHMTAGCIVGSTAATIVVVVDCLSDYNKLSKSCFSHFLV